jgi:hypothetical protein
LEEDLRGLKTPSVTTRRTIRTWWENARKFLAVFNNGMFSASSLTNHFM